MKEQPINNLTDTELLDALDQWTKHNEMIWKIGDKTLLAGVVVSYGGIRKPIRDVIRSLLSLRSV